MLEKRLYVGIDGKLCHFYVTKGEMMKLLNMTRKDIIYIIDAFKAWAHYWPGDSKNREHDFDMFVNHIIAPQNG